MLNKVPAQLNTFSCRQQNLRKKDEFYKLFKGRNGFVWDTVTEMCSDDTKKEMLNEQSVPKEYSPESHSYVGLKSLVCACVNSVA